MPRKDLLELIPPTNPDYMWLADRPLSLGGTPVKTTISEVESKLQFEYSEGLFVSKNHKGMPEEDAGERSIFQRVQQRLNSPLNDKLVVCFIDARVGWGVFAREPIEAGTIFGIYAGEVEYKSGEDDYGMTFADLDQYNLRVNAHAMGGITRFIQHMPFSYEPICEAIDASNKEKLLKILDGNGYFFDSEDCDQLNDKKTLRATKDKYTAIFNRDKGPQGEIEAVRFNLPSGKQLAVANIKAVPLIYNKMPVIYFQACMDIKPMEQLGVYYGIEYWNKKHRCPEYFYKTGEVIPKENYKFRKAIYLAAPPEFTNQASSSTTKPTVSSSKNQQQTSKWVQLNNDGAESLKKENYAVAIDSFQQALRIKEKGGDTDSVDYATLLFHLGEAYRRDKQYSLGEGYLNRAVAMRLKWLGPNDANTKKTQERLQMCIDAKQESLNLSVSNK